MGLFTTATPIPPVEMSSDRISDEDTVANEVERMMRLREESAVVAPKTQETNQVIQNFALYHRDPEQCIGSRAILQLLKPVQEDFMTVDIAALGSDLPPWLDGTPIVVDNRTDEKIIYRGSEAVFFVRNHYGEMVKSSQ